MCYHVSQTKDRGTLESRFGAWFRTPELFRPLYHVSGFSAPFLPVVPNYDAQVIELFQWGLVPFWVKGEEAARMIRSRTLNARAETLREKPSFRHLINKKRCLVLVDGFYEWREVGRRKYPYYITIRGNRAFALAGLWDNWSDEHTGETRSTFSVVTTRANTLMERIHNTRMRMPVILQPEAESEWLRNDLDGSQVLSLLGPYDDSEMQAHTVSGLISRKGAMSDTPEAIREVRYEGLD